MNLEPLHFVKGGVSKKDFVPALQYFDIENGRILGYNGSMALSSPIDINITCKPKALPFIKAIQTCRDPVVSMFVAPNNKLAIKSGTFTAYVDCIEEKDYPDISPKGELVDLDGNLLEVLFTLAPFIAEDASRPWARGILLRGKSAFVTNNVIVIEKWLGTPFPVEINLPEETVYEIMRIKEEPIKLQISENSATFHFQGDRWLWTSLYDTKWPNVEPIFSRESDCKPFPDFFFSALEDLVPFTDDLHRVFFVNGERVSTVAGEDIGASIQVPGLPAAGCYNVHQLRLLERIVEKIDLSLYPNPCLFFGDKLRGAIIGMQF
jgi:hypothetical protein